jgi:hypothetical protein
MIDAEGIVCDGNPYPKEACDVRTQHSTVFSELNSQPHPNITCRQGMESESSDETDITRSTDN